VPPYAETREYVRRALVAYHGSAAGLGAATLPPLVGGDFRGVSLRAPRAVPARLVTLDRETRLLSNAGPARRVAPVLGRVEPEPAADSSGARALRP